MNIKRCCLNQISRWADDLRDIWINATEYTMQIRLWEPPGLFNGVTNSIITGIRCRVSEKAIHLLRHYGWHYHRGNLKCIHLHRFSNVCSCIYIKDGCKPSVKKKSDSICIKQNEVICWSKRFWFNMSNKYGISFFVAASVGVKGYSLTTETWYPVFFGLGVLFCEKTACYS